MFASQQSTILEFFSETRDHGFLRQVSDIADEMAGPSSVGAKVSPAVACVFMLNSLTGLSLLTMPYGFSQAGVLLGGAILFFCMVMAYITASFMCEALTIANALTYEEAEVKVIMADPEMRENLHREKEETFNKLKDVLLPADVRKCKTVDLFKAQARSQNSQAEFKIRQRVELGQMGELILKERGGFGSKLATGIYIMVLSFTYGTAMALVVTVNTSLAHTVNAVRGVIVGPESTAWDEDYIYKVCVFVVFGVTLPLCFADLQRTKKITQGVMVLRFIAIAFLIGIGTFHTVGRIRTEGAGAVLDGVPLWRGGSFMSVFGNAIFLFGIHHYLPSMISPLEPQTRAPYVIRWAFVSCFIIIFLVCLTAQTAWSGESDAVCSQRPGGHFCSIQPLYNLNFVPLDWLGGSIAIFLTAYPSMAITSIPIAAITTRNTMARWLGLALPPADKPFTFNNVMLTLVVLVPPQVVALITKDVQSVIKYVGGYAGLVVTVFCPLVLLMSCRKELQLDEDLWCVKDRPLRSPFGNRYGYSLVALYFAVAFVAVTDKLFFAPA